MNSNRARVQLILDNDLYRWIISEAKRKGISLSLTIRDALRKEYEEWKATEELLSDPDFTKAYRQGLIDVSRGDVIEWKKVRKDV